MPQAQPILIIGAGPTGLVLALTLRQNGVPVRIIEKDAAFHIGARASGIMPRTLETYNFLGVLPDIMKASGPIQSIRDYELPGGTKPLDTWPMIPYHDPTPSRPYLGARVLAQNMYQEILRYHLAKYHCHVELGAELRDFEDHRDKVVAIIARKGLDGSEVIESFTASYLVGADGAKSIVRKRLGMQFDGEPYPGVNMVFADVRLHSSLENEIWHKWGEMSNAMVIIRKTENVDMYWVLAGGKCLDTSTLLPEPASMSKWIAAITGRDDIEISQVLTYANYTPQMRMVKEFGKGRVFLTGDAAHVHSPAGGQGMNNGVADSFNLGWRLCLAHKSLASPNLLSNYSEERTPIIKAMLARTTDILGQSIASSWGKFAYNMGPADRLPLYQLDLHYRWSSMVLDETPGGQNGVSNGALDTAPVKDDRVRAGDRAPDAPGIVDMKDSNCPVKTLFQYFKPTHHTALIFSASEAAIDSFVSALRNVPPNVVLSTVVIPSTTVVCYDNLDNKLAWKSNVDYSLKDAAGHAYRAYLANLPKSDVAVIVRPDGVVGAIVADGSGMSRYFQKILAV